MNHDSRPIGWIGAARKSFERFAPGARDRIASALTIAAEGGKADVAKPLKGMGAGVMEIAVRYRSDAYRCVYVTEIAGSLWVLHAFQKKSKTGIKTPRAEIDLVRDRLGRLRKELDA
ncbi:MAG: type II toxin-antitoxin system RelE/ParE family toxin [Alphaproteobacteria bacterium]